MCSGTHPRMVEEKASPEFKALLSALQRAEAVGTQSVDDC